MHTGQIVRQGASVSGAAFEVAGAIAAEAPSGSAYASKVLVDLVPGSDLGFSEVGGSVSMQGREIALFSIQPKS